MPTQPYSSTPVRRGARRLAPPAWASTSVALAALVLAALFRPTAARAQGSTLVLSSKWSLAPGASPIVPTSGGNPRSIAINRLSGNVLVPSLVGSNHVHVFSGATGADLGALATGGTGNGIITGGTLALLGIGVADDGVIYAANLDNSANVFKIYRWSTEDRTGTTQPTVAFGGSTGATPGTTTTRCGDSFFVRGAGVDTQIIASGTGSGLFTVFTTTDGTNFTANQMSIPATPGAGGFNRTVAFDGTNNAFWGGKPNDTKLYYVTFNLGTLTATTLSNITFSPAMGMCAVRATNSLTVLAGIQDSGSVSSSSRNLLVYDLSSLSGVAQGGSVAFPAGGSADGNVTGQADIGAGMVVGFSTQGGIVALNVLLQANTPPSLTTSPVGASGVFPTYNLTVGASGTKPLAYQWLASNSRTNLSGTFTNVPGQTNSTYALTSAVTNYFEVIVTNAYGSITSTPVLVSLLTPVTSTVVTQLWNVPAGANGYSYLSATDNSSRGLGYDTNSQRLVVASTTGGSGLYILDANTGTNLGTLSLSGVSFGGLLGGVDQVGIADDGVVYAGNLVSGLGYTLYSWPAPTNGATATQAFVDNYGALGGDRWGDTMAVRGAGTGTQILLGSRSGTNVALLTTADGINFSGQVIAISNAPVGFAANGIAFGAGNTLWAKANLGHLYQVAFDPVGLTGGVLQDYANPAKIPTYQVGAAVDSLRNLLAGIDLNDTPHDVKLYQLTGTADAPVLFDQAFFTTANGNGNANVALVMKYPRLYALDVNNGLLGLTYAVPPTTPPLITAPPASQTVYTNDPAVSFGVSVSGSLPLYYQWQFATFTNSAAFANIANATNSAYTLHNPPLSAAGYYRVVVHNLAGYATSAPPAQLTVVVPVTSLVVTQVWTLAAGSRSYLDGSTYNTRGLAYDTNTAKVLVCDHDNIYVLNAADGSDAFQMNVLGVYNGGYNSGVFNQIGVADDGAVYGANLYGANLGGSGFSITRWSAVDPGAGLYQAYGGTAGADPGNNSGDRWGDTLDVRGSGAGTELLIGSYGGTNVVLFTTLDGFNFTPNVIAVTNVPAGFAGQGIAFGSGDSFWAKTPGYNLRRIVFDRTTWTGGAVDVFTVPTQFPSAFDGIGVDVAASVLGGVNFATTPNALELYLLSGNANAPALANQAFFSSNNLNSQQNAVTTLKGGFGVALDVNNGLAAVTYSTPAAPAVSLTSVAYAPNHVTLTWNNVFNGHNYQVQYKSKLTDTTWNNLGSPIPGAGPTATYVDTTASGTQRFYRVISQ